MAQKLHGGRPSTPGPPRQLSYFCYVFFLERSRVLAAVPGVIFYLPVIQMDMGEEVGPILDWVPHVILLNLLVGLGDQDHPHRSE